MSSGSKAPSGYQPAQQAQADQGFMSGAGALASGGQQLQQTAIPGYQQLYSGAQSNPYYAGAQQAAGGIAQAGQGFQQNATADQQALQSFGNTLGSYAPGIAQTAFDPQGAMYQRNYQQQMEQQNAINSMYGVAGSPYGAGVAGQTANNFNIDWQNTQQQRQLAGIQGMGQLGSAMNSAYTGGQNIGAQGIQVGGAAQMMPNQVYQQQQQYVQSALDALVGGTNQAYQPTQQSVSDYGTYMGLGQSATRNAQQATQMNNASQDAFSQGLGGLAQGAFGMATNPLSLFGQKLW